MQWKCKYSTFGCEKLHNILSEGEDQCSLEAIKNYLAEEMKKRPQNVQLVKQKMNKTFTLRRKVMEIECAAVEFIGLHSSLKRF